MGRTAYEVLEALQEGEPRIYLNEERAWDGVIGINPMELHDEDLLMVVGRVREVLLGEG